MKNILNMTGKKVLITGGSRGLGYAMALGFAGQGADIAITSRKIESCKAAADDVRRFGVETFVHPCHVGQWSELEKLADAVYDHFGRVDVLINNAGMSPVAPSSMETSEALFDKIVAVNFKGPFRLSALVGSRMANTDGGSIINISSTASVRPTPETAPYSGAKAGLNAITIAFAKEFGPKVRVNAIMCGPFHTDATRNWSKSEEFETTAKKNIALQRVGFPGEVVSTALYLASDASSYTTGSIVEVHGGAI